MLYLKVHDQICMYWGGYTKSTKFLLRCRSLFPVYSVQETDAVFCMELFLLGHLLMQVHVRLVAVAVKSALVPLRRGGV